MNPPASPLPSAAQAPSFSPFVTQTARRRYPLAHHFAALMDAMTSYGKYEDAVLLCLLAETDTANQHILTPANRLAEMSGGVMNARVVNDRLHQLDKRGLFFLGQRRGRVNFEALRQLVQTATETPLAWIRLACIECFKDVYLGRILELLTRNGHGEESKPFPTTALEALGIRDRALTASRKALFQQQIITTARHKRDWSLSIPQLNERLELYFGALADATPSEAVWVPGMRRILHEVAELAQTETDAALFHFPH